MSLTVSLSNKKVTPATKNLPDEIKLDEKATAKILVDLVSKATKLNPNRIRLTVKPEESKELKKEVVLRNTEELQKYAVDKNVHVFVRDLGPQIAWKAVIFIEYIGPLLICPLFFFGQKYIYGTEEPHTSNQKFIFAAIMLHFLKREYETLFVHKFSLATMPVFNLFKNCGHYWLLCGCIVSYFCFAPDSWSSTGSELDSYLYRTKGLFPHENRWSLFLCWFLAEGSNYVTHKNLASLRPAGTSIRRIPHGYGFTNVSCPNYFFEMLSWICVCVLSGNWAMILFTVAGSIQMGFWAVKKHRRYKKEFPNYPVERDAFIPHII